MMSDLRPPPAEIASRRKRRNELARELAELRRERDLETRAENKLRQDETIREREARLAEAEATLRPVELVEKADEMERKQSWQAAIAAWEQVAELVPRAPAPAVEIVRLRERERIATRLQAASTGVMRRRHELGELWTEVRVRLQGLRASGIVEEDVLALIEDFLAGKVDADELVDVWHELHRPGEVPVSSSPPYDVLAGRLRRGELALFLGSEVARDFDAGHLGCAELAAKLARRAETREIEPMLATVGEYYHLSDHGRSTLVRHLRELLPGSCEVPLYDLLAGLGANLVIVSAAWDELLEDAFRAAGKPFAVISPLVGAAVRRGTVDLSVERSDGDGEELIESDKLSGLRLLDAGYSLIYKARGAIAPTGSGRRRPAAALTLAERDHFAFARDQNVLVPTYLARLLAERGLLILGLAARQWEDRLLLDAVLDKRRSTDKPFVVRHLDDAFETAFWQEHARRYGVALPELVENLKARLAPPKHLQGDAGAGSSAAAEGEVAEGPR